MQKFLERLDPRLLSFLIKNCNCDTNDSILFSLEAYGLVNSQDIDNYFRTGSVDPEEEVVEPVLSRKFGVLITKPKDRMLKVYHSVFTDKDLESLRFELSSNLESLFSVELVASTPYRIGTAYEANKLTKFKRLVLEADMRNASDIYLSVKPRYGSDEVFADNSCRISLKKFPLESVSLTTDEINDIVRGIIKYMSPRSDFDLDNSKGVETVVLDPIGDKTLSLRVSSMKTRWGYKGAYRLIRESGEIRDLSDLGFDQTTQDVLRALAFKPTGLSIVAGAMGNGKTNTVNAIVAIMASMNLEITEVSAPPENRLPISQVDYEGSVEYLYDVISLLRKQALDVAVVGEMNNRKVAKAVIDLVTSNVHTLVSLHLSRTYHLPNKLKSFLDEEYKDILPQLNICLTQILEPTLCPHCKTEKSLDLLPEGIKTLLSQYDYPIYHYYESQGCSKCSESVGLTAFAEYIEFTSEIVDTLMGMDSPYDMQVYIKNYMKEKKTLLEYRLLEGISKGRISINSLYRIL